MIWGGSCWDHSCCPFWRQELRWQWSSYQEVHRMLMIGWTKLLTMEPIPHYIPSEFCRKYCQDRRPWKSWDHEEASLCHRPQSQMVQCLEPSAASQEGWRCFHWWKLIWRRSWRYLLFRHGRKPCQCHFSMDEHPHYHVISTLLFDILPELVGILLEILFKHTL